MALTFVNSNLYALPFTLSNAHVDATLSGFVWRIKIVADTDLYAHAMANGYDCRPTLEDGTLLTFSRVNWTRGGSSVDAAIDVNLPTTLSSAPTVIYLQFGNQAASDVSTNPHDANTQLALRLDETGTVTNWIDVTGNSNAANTGATAGTGKVGGCADFSGSGQYASCGNVLGYTRSTAFSVSFWMKSSSSSSEANIISKQVNSGNYQGWIVGFSGGAASRLQFALYYPSNGLIGRFPSAYSDGNWHHVAVTYDGSSAFTGLAAYVDGAAVTLTNVGNTTMTGDISNSSNFQLSGRGGGNTLYTGSLDEVRVASTVRAAAWAKLLYYNADGADVTKGSLIVDDSVTVTYPNGSEKFIVGDSENVAWTKGSLVSQVSVAISRDNGANYTDIATGQTGTSYAWTVAGQVATQAKVRVTATAGGTASDASDAAFRIATTTQENNPVIGCSFIRGLRV